MTLLAALGLVYRLDQTASDLLYQRRTPQDGEIVLVGMDDRAIAEFGPFTTWTRDLYAQAIEALNASEDCRPAAIAIDVLFTGENDPDLDAWLAEAAAEYGNVIAASAYTFGRDMVQRADGTYGYEDFSILEEGSAVPYDALRRRCAISTSWRMTTVSCGTICSGYSRPAGRKSLPSRWRRPISTGRMLAGSR